MESIWLLCGYLPLHKRIITRVHPPYTRWTDEVDSKYNLRKVIMYNKYCDTSRLTAICVGSCVDVSTLRNVTEFRSPQLITTDDLRYLTNCTSLSITTDCDISSLVMLRHLKIKSNQEVYNLQLESFQSQGSCIINSSILTVLSIAQNDIFTNQHLASFTKLVDLSVSSCPLITEVTNLQLTRLLYQNNGGLQVITHLTNLKTLHTTHDVEAPITVTDLTGRFKKLPPLVTKFCYYRGVDEKYYPQLTEYRCVVSLTDDALRLLDNCIHLSCNILTSEYYPPKLRSLDCMIPHLDMKKIPFVTSLTVLGLQSNAITNAHLMTRLVTLKINKLYPEEAKYLINCKHLVVNNAITSDCLELLPRLLSVRSKSQNTPNTDHQSQFPHIWFY